VEGHVHSMSDRMNNGRYEGIDIESDSEREFRGEC
jgi:hypothetical protein